MKTNKQHIYIKTLKGIAPSASESLRYQYGELAINCWCGYIGEPIWAVEWTGGKNIWTGNKCPECGQSGPGVIHNSKSNDYIELENELARAI